VSIRCSSCGCRHNSPDQDSLRELRARVSELEAKLSSIPWDDLEFVLTRGLDDVFVAVKCSAEPLNAVYAWLAANLQKK
jgi:hypothetical protein